MRCDEFTPPVVRWKERPSAGLSLHLWASLSISPVSPSLLQAAFLCHYLTVVVNNPRYGFQMTPRPPLELGIGLEHSASVKG